MNQVTHIDYERFVIIAHVALGAHRSPILDVDGAAMCGPEPGASVCVPR